MPVEFSVRLTTHSARLCSSLRNNTQDTRVLVELLSCVRLTDVYCHDISVLLTFCHHFLYRTVSNVKSRFRILEYCQTLPMVWSIPFSWAESNKIEGTKHFELANESFCLALTLFRVPTTRKWQYTKATDLRKFAKISARSAIYHNSLGALFFSWCVSFQMHCPFKSEIITKDAWGKQKKMPTIHSHNNA